MKYIIKLFALVLPVLLLWNCGDSIPKATISGSLNRAMEVPVWIGNLDVDKIVPLDSAKSDKEGKFSFEISISEPSLYLVTVGPKSIYLVIHPEEKLNIEVDNTSSEASYYVEGSIDSRLVQEIMTKQERVLDEITIISQEYENSKADPESFQERKSELDNRYNKLLEDHKAYTKNIIFSNPQSLACIFALYQNFGKTSQPLFDKFEDFDMFNFVDSVLTLKYPNTPAVKALNSDVIDIQTQLKYKKYSEKLTEPGKKAPEFEVKTLENKQLKLSDYKGNPVVYFFFATWNKVSVEETLKINELAKRYRYSGLKIIGISFDSSEEHLLKFIEENEILFPVVCDYKYWESDYVEQFGIRQIPDLLLINKDHIIEQKNITSIELNQILSEWRRNKVF